MGHLAQTIEGKATYRVTIASGETTSGLFPTYGYARLAVETPESFDGTALSLQLAERKDATYKNVGDASGAISVPCGPSQILLFGDVLVSPYGKIVSNASEGAERTLVIHLLS